MNDVNLNDLKIKHKPIAGAQKKSPLTGFILLIIGILLGIVLYHFWLQGMMTREKTPPEGSPAQNNGAQTPEPPPPPPAESFTEGGWIEVPSYHPVIVSALIPGRLEALKVLEGTKVKKGDLIAVLYQRDIQDEVKKATALANAARANLARLEAGFRTQEVAQAKAAVAAQKAEVDLKKEIQERTQSLLASGAVSQEDLDEDTAALKVAQARLDALVQDLALKEEGSRTEDIAAAQANLEQKQAELALAKSKLEYTSVQSPVDGVVMERFVTPGTFIHADNPKIVSIYDPEDLQVRVDVRQENIGNVYLGQKVSVTTEAEPPPTAYPGTVIRIEPVADFKKNTIQVKIKLASTSDKLHPEMIAQIKFIRKATNDTEDNR